MATMAGYLLLIIISLCVGSSIKWNYSYPTEENLRSYNDLDNIQAPVKHLEREYESERISQEDNSLVEKPRYAEHIQNIGNDGSWSYELDRDLSAFKRRPSKLSQKEYFKSFQPFDEMIKFMMDSITRCQGRCSLFNIGSSYHDRPLIGIKITSGQVHAFNKPKIWISAGIHAREWISHTSAMYLINALIEGFDTDNYVHHLVERYEWYILPCVNPDGYNYTWTTDRMWRKTRSYNPGTDCVGTDANRNFDFRWGDVGSGSDPCANDYRGPAPFSEPESRHVAKFILSEARTGPWLMFLTLHSAGQLVMSPWGYTRARPVDYAELRRVGQAIAVGISNKNNLPFRFGSAANVLYYSSGTCHDWARGVANMRYAYTIELRRGENNRWVIADDEIEPAGEELWAGLISGMKAIERRRRHNDP